MGKDKGQQSQAKPSEKLEKDRKAISEGTTKPLPTSGPAATAEEKAVDAANLAKAKKISAEAEALKKKMDQLKKELEEAKKAEKAERDKEKLAKEAEKAKTLAERAKKEKELEEADAAIAKAQKDLELTDEWKALEKAKKVREAIGPLPKVAKGGTRAPRDPNAGPATYGLERDHDLPWCEKKETLFKALKKLGATSATTACSTGELVDASGLVGRDVRHYSYHAKAGGLVDVAELDGKKGYCFFLTKAGLEELTKQEAESKKS